MPAPSPDWRCRHGVAQLQAAAIAQLAAVAGDALVRLSVCEGDLADLHLATTALRAALDEAERLSQHFDCADLHAASTD